MLTTSTPRTRPSPRPLPRAAAAAAFLVLLALGACARRGVETGGGSDIMTPPGTRAGATAPAAAPAAAAAAAANPVPSAAVTTVLLVRHAERPPGADPSLDAAGQARAQALADALASAGVSAIYTTQFRRTQETAAPLAQRLGIVPQVIAARGGDSAAVHAQEVAAAIRARHAGGVVLVVGHSNTVPLIVRALGGTAPDQIADAEYGNLFIVTVGETGVVRTIRARYGT
ncbi:MAG TPA: phosphoglycerate mutase family protein [Gemmatimonadaceae bacterium]|nr:phosphoglycerate mutase family protein [Gemmatimonadaceae bacterium]